jgi:hypothetical protein
VAERKTSARKGSHLEEADEHLHDADSALHRAAEGGEDPVAEPHDEHGEPEKAPAEKARPEKPERRPSGRHHREPEPEDGSEPQPGHWHDGEVHKARPESVVTGGHDPDQASLSTDRAGLTVPAPPGVSGELAIDAAQVGGSSRGGEWNTAPHPGSPTSDRLTESKEQGHGQQEREAAPGRRAGR